MYVRPRLSPAQVRSMGTPLLRCTALLTAPPAQKLGVDKSCGLWYNVITILIRRYYIMSRDYRKDRRDVLQIRLSAAEKRRWSATAAYAGYDSMAAMVRDLVEGLNAQRVAKEISNELSDHSVGDAYFM